MAETAQSPRPAPLPARLAAGIMDAVLIIGISAAIDGTLVTSEALALPLLAPLAATVIWAVVPCALCGGTLFMRAFGVGIVSTEGRNVHLAEMLGRELIGRGFIAYAYVFSAAVALFGWSAVSVRFFRPHGIGLLLLFAAAAIIVFSTLGQMLIFARRDRCGLPDLVSRTRVVPLDEKAVRPRPVRKAVALDLAALAVAFVPSFALSRTPRAASEFAARTKIEAAAKAFEADPKDDFVAAQLVYLLLEIGDREKAERIEARHADAQIAELDRSIAAGGGTAKTYTRMGRIYLRQRDLPAARLSFEKALQLDPNLEDARRDLDFTLRKLRGEP